MHELPITESILEIAIKHANKANAKAITDIHLVIGQLSSYIDDSIQFYWEMLSKDTIAENAHLHFKRISMEFRCHQCNTVFTPQDKIFLCPSCESVDLEVVAGKEFYLESIEIKT